MLENARIFEISAACQWLTGRTGIMTVYQLVLVLAVLVC